LKQSSGFDLRTCARCAEIAPKKIFGWLRNITNSAGIRLAAKKSAAARRRLTKFGVAALGGGAGVYVEFSRVGGVH